MSAPLSFDRANVAKTLKVFGWTIASTLTALAIALWADVSVPTEYAVLVPLVNTLLVGLKQYFDGQEA
jgi:hypothetical protein